MWPNTGRELRVGALLLAGLVVLGAAILLIGRETNLFVRKARYTVHFPNAQGLNVGGPVQLSGVKVGAVIEVRLPEGLEEERVEVRIAIDRHHAPRVRGDSVARIKTLGLLGDRYIEITSGSTEFPPLAPGAEIPAAAATDIDKLIASGENVVENVVGISHSLNSLLLRLERGEGLLGELTTDSEAGRQLRTSAVATLDAVEGLAKNIEQGKGPLGRLIHDEKLGDQLAEAVARANGVLTKVESGKGLLPALLDDPETKAKLDRTLDGANQAVDQLAALAAEVREGKGLLPKLLHDERYGSEVADELRGLITKLNTLADKVGNGDGTVGRLINDPSIFDAANDIVIGINESKLLRWLIRNRQKEGIETRYEDERRRQGLSVGPPEEPPADGTNGR